MNCNQKPVDVYNGAKHGWLLQIYEHMKVRAERKKRQLRSYDKKILLRQFKQTKDIYANQMKFSTLHNTLVAEDKLDQIIKFVEKYLKKYIRLDNIYNNYKNTI